MSCGSGHISNSNIQSHDSPAAAALPVRLLLQPLLLLLLLPPAPPLPPSPPPLLLQPVPHAAPAQQPGVPASLTQSVMPAAVGVRRVSPPAGVHMHTHCHVSITAALNTLLWLGHKGLVHGGWSECMACWPALTDLVPG